MTIDDKIENTRKLINGLKPASKQEKTVLESIADILNDLNREVDELNEIILC